MKNNNNAGKSASEVIIFPFSQTFWECQFEQGAHE